MSEQVAEIRFPMTNGEIAAQFDEIAELLVQLRELKARHDHTSSTDE